MNLSCKILIFLFLLSISLYSQEKYKIIYDYKTEQVSYLKIDEKFSVIDTLKSPKVKRNSLIEIQLENVNPFAVDVVADVKEEVVHKSNEGFGFGTLLGSISNYSAEGLNLAVKNLPSDSLFKSNNSRSSTISNDFVDFNDKISNISALETTLISNLHNPNFDKETIVKNLLNTAMIEQDVRLPNPLDNFYVYLTKFEKIIQEDKEGLTSEVEEISKEIDNTSNLSKEVSRGGLVKRNMAINNLQELLQNLGNSTEKTVQSLQKVKALYTLLEASEFSKTYDYQIEADKVNIELKFTPSEFSQESSNTKNDEPIRTRNIKLFSKGGFKINSSLALTLNNFSSKSNDFFVDENNVIGADPNDYFTPNLSTMINFYPYSGGSVNVGGSFGISIPISGQDNISGLNFLLGPSLHFGNESRFSLSGGLAYGPVERLKDGLQVGSSTDLTTDQINALTKNVYELGYFFGVSFSLFDIN